MGKKSDEAAYRMLIIMAAIAFVLIIVLTIIRNDYRDREDAKEAALKKEMAESNVPAFSESDYPVGEPKKQGLYTFVRIHEYGGDEKDIHVRTAPTMKSDIIANIEVGTSFTTREYYEMDGYYGFPQRSMSYFFSEDEDKDGILWISKFYTSVSTTGPAEEADHPDTYKKFRCYENHDRFIIKVKKGEPQLRSMPSTDYASSSYGSVAEDCRIEAKEIYRSEDYMFFGFDASMFDELYLQEEPHGDISKDPDGIVWISRDYVDIQAIY